MNANREKSYKKLYSNYVIFLLLGEIFENYKKLEGIILIIVLAHKYQILFLVFIIQNNYYPQGDSLLNNIL